MGKHKILQASVEINGGCNYSCPMCPQSLGREKTFLKKLPLNVFSKTVEELSELGCREIHLQGSGEPLLGNNIYEYLNIARENDIQCSIVTNGFYLNKHTCLSLLDSGMKNIRVSVIGYDRETYHHWMSQDAFDHVYQNCRTAVSLIDNGGYDTKLTSYHLVLDNKKRDWEIKQYQLNWIKPLQIDAEIWMMHNWAGGYDTNYERKRNKKRSCGRPFAPYITVRAGGSENRYGAVVPCCYVLGQDSKAILGHTDLQTLQEILDDLPYKKLRNAHRRERFDDIDYCKNCDQLYDVPESLVWTNIKGKKYGQHKTNQGIDLRSKEYLAP